MALNDNSTRKGNIAAGAPRFLIDKGRPIQNIGTAHPLTRLLLGQEKTVGDERLGKLLRFSGVQKPKGEKMEANHQGKVIGDRPLTRSQSFDPTTKSDVNTIFTNTFPYARRIQTWHIPGIDMDRLSSDGYFDPIDGYMNAADQGMFDSFSGFLFNKDAQYALPSVTNVASLDAMISDGQNLGSFNETAYRIYGDYDRSQAENTALRGVVVRGPGSATTGFGGMSKEKFRMIQALTRRKGGRNDVFVANDMVVAGWNDLFQEHGSTFESPYDELLQETGSTYIKYAGTIILGDPDCDPEKGYMLDLDTFHLFWDGLAPGSRANTTKV
ncbi:hypothetical protein EON81_28970, partial [bacterium]